ncbi:hypothetical protein [Anaeropeptidivorans aminofermentans]|uniref:hypothetical protein n=1 Tax=Anaeropeptidivorans aminofermentans TaxID=2934315 RepID=UPI00202448CD|nr:hypothetical protein [Anaeropeptidivorans aminofermentans]
MVQNVKSPNEVNKKPGYCNISKCNFKEKCFFGFNSAGVGRELRIDFNECNLSCPLCWSDNNYCNVEGCSSEEIYNRFINCISMRENYLENKYGEVSLVANKSSFNLMSFQIVGGEPLISKDRFIFIYNFLESINTYISNCVQNNIDSFLNLNKSNCFKIKLFTNGIEIGNGNITRDMLESLNSLAYLDIRLKGLKARGFLCKYDDIKKQREWFRNQVNAFKVLSTLSVGSIKLEPVLGFYHSEIFNIKLPTIKSSNMFTFDENDEDSEMLRCMLKKHISKKGKFYVEPIHAKNKGQEQNFFDIFSEYLENTSLIEPKLVANNRKNYMETKLSDLL